MFYNRKDWEDVEKGIAILFFFGGIGALSAVAFIVWLIVWAVNHVHIG